MLIWRRVKEGGFPVSKEPMDVRNYWNGNIHYNTYPIAWWPGDKLVPS